MDTPTSVETPNTIKKNGKTFQKWKDNYMVLVPEKYFRKFSSGINRDFSKILYGTIKMDQVNNKLNTNKTKERNMEYNDHYQECVCDSDENISCSKTNQPICYANHAVPGQIQYKPLGQTED